MRYLGRSYEFSHHVIIMAAPERGSSFFSDPGGCSQGEGYLGSDLLGGLIRRFAVPGARSRGVLEDISHPEARDVFFDPEAAGWGWSDFGEMISTLIVESDCDVVLVRSSSSVGLMRKGVDVYDAAKELVGSAVESSAYSSFYLSYEATKPMSWSKREKLRKESRRLRSQRIGSLSFDDGEVAEVMLAIDGAGYTFQIEFESDKAVSCFAESGRVRLSEWFF